MFVGIALCNWLCDIIIFFFEKQKTSYKITDFSKNTTEELTLQLSHILSEVNEGLTATVVVADRWSGSKVKLMLSFMGRISFSSLFPQYLITAIFVGALAVTINVHLCNFSPISQMWFKIIKINAVREVCNGPTSQRQNKQFLWLVWASNNSHLIKKNWVLCKDVKG